MPAPVTPLSVSGAGPGAVRPVGPGDRPGAPRPKTWMSPMHAQVTAKVMMASAEGS